MRRPSPPQRTSGSDWGPAGPLLLRRLQEEAVAPVPPQVEVGPFSRPAVVAVRCWQQEGKGPEGWLPVEAEGPVGSSIWGGRAAGVPGRPSIRVVLRQVGAGRAAGPHWLVQGAVDLGEARRTLITTTFCS